MKKMYYDSLGGGAIENPAYRLDPLENRVAEVLAKHFTVEQLEKLFSVSSLEQWEEILQMSMNEIENNKP